MTTRAFLSAAMRRWYVLLVGLALTGVAAALLAVQAPTVYWARTTVTLLEPKSNLLNSEGSTLTSLASALVVRANLGTTSRTTSSPATTLYGEGIMKGSRIRIRDEGAQWATSIPNPIIDVEAVGPDPEGVANEIAAMVQRLNAELSGLQAQLDVPKKNSVVMSVSPTQPNVLMIRGSRIRSVGATLFMGMALTIVAIYLIDGAIGARGPHRSDFSLPERTPESSTA